MEVVEEAEVVACEFAEDHVVVHEIESGQQYCQLHFEKLQQRQPKRQHQNQRGREPHVYAHVRSQEFFYTLDKDQ